MKKHVYVSKPLDSHGLIDWTETEDQTWSTLIHRQTEVIKNRACQEFSHALDLVSFPKDKTPQLKDVNKKLMAQTGWQVQNVAALIQPDEFFTLLSNKKFPAATFIRIPEELDYLQEPDIFHELFGHVPLLSHPTYAHFVHEFGKKALTLDPKDRSRLFRLFWFTVEFGLINTQDGVRAYGAGILSSIGETQYALTDQSQKKPFSLMDALRTPFRVDIMQPLYYVINSFDDLYKILDVDIKKELDESRVLKDFAPLFPPKPKKTETDTDGVMAC